MTAEAEGFDAGGAGNGDAGNGGPELDPAALREQIELLQAHVRRAEERRRALVHIMGDLKESNQKLAEQRKAMLHILGDYENDRSRLARQTERLDNSRRALLHILKDSHESNLRLGDSRKAMIHIMGDLRETTQEMERREHELRDKQEQLVQAGKLATLGELTTGVAHELNNPLNNIGLYVGNVIDRIRLGEDDTEPLVLDLEKAMEQVRKATEIISHLRTFGRAARVSIEQVDVDDVIERSLLLVHEQLRLRGIEVELELCPEELLVVANPIQLEQVFINLLTNARDALTASKRKTIRIASSRDDERIRIGFSDTGPGIPPELQKRIFDPFFTTKEVGTGTGLGLSITYSILKEYGGEISVTSEPGKGATFLVELPFADEEPAEEPLL
jgi:C4-dicarboxylate-specific signal transduction histidine kinase